MDQLNLPRHVVERFEKRWARKLQQQVAVWRATRSPARSRTDSGCPGRAAVAANAACPRPVAGREPGTGALATILGVLTVLVTASGVFGEMHTALNATFKAKPIDEPIFSLFRTVPPAWASSPPSVSRWW
jgi:hypothetical protein